MSIILKINLAVVKDELANLGKVIFDKNEKVEVISKVEIDDLTQYQQSEYYSVFYVLQFRCIHVLKLVIFYYIYQKNTTIKHTIIREKTLKINQAQTRLISAF